jgi:hypothetical protein
MPRLDGGAVHICTDAMADKDNNKKTKDKIDFINSPIIVNLLRLFSQVFYSGINSVT